MYPYIALHIPKKEISRMFELMVQAASALIVTDSATDARPLTHTGMYSHRLILLWYKIFDILE